MGTLAGHGCLVRSREGHGEQPSTKNGPALVGYRAEAVRDEIARVIATLPDQLQRRPMLGQQHRRIVLRDPRTRTSLTKQIHQPPAGPPRGLRLGEC